VLVRVVTLGADSADAPLAGFVTDASAPAGEVAIAEANGRRIGEIAIVPSGAAMLRVPATFRGRRGDLTAWRREAGARAAAPWAVLRPRVRDDGTLPFAGLPVGRYDFEFRIDGATLVATDVNVPGDVVLSADR